MVYVLDYFYGVYIIADVALKHNTPGQQHPLEHFSPEPLHYAST